MLSSNIYEYFITPETSDKKIGLFRILCSIFGGLLVAYLGATLFAIVAPFSLGESLVVSLMFNTFVWACTALWISLSYTKLSALLRSIVPSIIFYILILILQ